MTTTHPTTALQILDALPYLARVRRNDDGSFDLYGHRIEGQKAEWPAVSREVMAAVIAARWGVTL